MQIMNTCLIMIKQKKVHMTSSEPISYDGLKHVEVILTPEFIIKSDKNNNFGSTLVADVDYLESLQQLYKDCHFILEKK